MTPVASTHDHRLSGFKTIPTRASKVSAAPAQRLRFGVNHRWNALCFSCKRIRPPAAGSALESTIRPVHNALPSCSMGMKASARSEAHVSFDAYVRPISIHQCMRLTHERWTFGSRDGE